MDGERSSATNGAGGEPGKPARGHKLPAWSDAIPDDLDRGDQLEVAARMQFHGWRIAFERALQQPGLTIQKRMALMSQASNGMAATIDKRRLWLAEQIIRGNERAIAETRRGPELESRDHAAGTNIAEQASRPTARRGRPRKR